MTAKSNKEEQITIGIAEDHKLFREALIPLLESEPTFRVIFDVNDGNQLIKKIQNVKPDVLLLDIEMPILSGKEAIRILRQTNPKLKIIILSSHFVRKVIVDLIKMGVCAFLPKTGEKEILVKAIKEVHQTGTYFDKVVSDIMAKELSKVGNKNDVEGREVQFSDIELSIIKMICQNKVSKDIAAALDLNVRTVEWYRLKIMKATASKKVPDLLIYALKHQLVTVV